MNGIPGPGGSLGACCYCGKPFLKEILLGQKVRTVEVVGVTGYLPVHNDCVISLQDTKEFTDLPDGSPLKVAYLSALNCGSAADGESPIHSGADV